jgi:undecaprenyl-diphosphatase
MDLNIFNVIHGLAGQSGLLDFLGVILAKYLPYIVILIALWLLFREKDFRQKIFNSIFVALTVLISRGIVTESIRFFYDKQRPFQVLGFEPLISETARSFPSGHAAFLFGLAFAVFYFNRRWGWWFLALALLNGVARIFVGVHWPSDILGGIVVGLVSFLIVKLILEDKEKPPAEISAPAPAEE